MLQLTTVDAEVITKFVQRIVAVAQHHVDGRIEHHGVLRQIVHLTSFFLTHKEENGLSALLLEPFIITLAKLTIFRDFTFLLHGFLTVFALLFFSYCNCNFCNRLTIRGIKRGRERYRNDRGLDSKGWRHKKESRQMMPIARAALAACAPPKAAMRKTKSTRVLSRPRSGLKGKFPKMHPTFKTSMWTLR